MSVPYEPASALGGEVRDVLGDENEHQAAATAGGELYVLLALSFVVDGE